MRIENPRACLYKPLENGIHQYTFRRITRQAILEWGEFLDMTLPTARADRPLLLLVDLRQGGLMNIAQVHAILTRTLMKFPNHPTMRTAILCNAGRGKHLADAALSMFSANNDHDERLLTDNESDATLWLTQIQ